MKAPRARLLNLSAVMLLIFAVFPAFADITVQSRFGDVRVQRRGSAKWETVQTGTPLSPFDTIQTGPRSGTMLFISGSGNIVSIEENSRLVITESMGASGSKKPGFLLFAGKLKSRLQKGAAGADEFATPTAVVGVRGTEFIIAVADDGTSQIGVLNGEVQVTGQNGEVSLSSNQASEVPLAGGPTDKVAFTGDEDWNAWLKKTADSIKGREMDILADVGRALDYNYGLMDAIEQKSKDSLSRIETLKKKIETARRDGNEEEAGTAGSEITTLVTLRTRFIIDGQNTDLRNQALMAVAERIRSSEPKRKDIADSHASLKRKFDLYHSRYTAEKMKKGCLGF